MVMIGDIVRTIAEVKNTNGVYEIHPCGDNTISGHIKSTDGKLTDFSNGNEYTEYLTMLNEVLLYSQEQSDEDLQEKIISEMEQLLVLIQTNEATVSNLGKKIDDKVEIALPADIVIQINNLRENG